MALENDPKVKFWLLIIGIILLLIGIYGVGKTAVNLIFYSKYPQVGVLTINTNGSPAYFQRESDCLVPNGFIDETKTVEQRMLDEKKQQEICLSNVADDRERAKINDISQSVLFLILGIGVLVSRRAFFK